MLNQKQPEHSEVSEQERNQISHYRSTYYEK